MLEIKNYLVNDNPSPARLASESVAGRLPPLSLRGGVPPLNIRGGEGELLLAEIEQTIKSELVNKVAHSRGLYFLRGRQALVDQRREKYRMSLLRFRKAKTHLRPLRFFPYLRAVALSGSQALLNVTADSDIDLLIITKKNRIWLARALVSLYFQVLGQRRHDQNIAGRFCLNHYVAEGRTLAEDRNLYTALEYANLLPVLGAENLAKFWQKNPWIKEYLPAAASEAAVPFFDPPPRRASFRFSRLQKIFEISLDFTLGPILNYTLGRYQKHRIRKQHYILVSDDELSFHPGSRGQQVLESLKAKLS